LSIDQNVSCSKTLKTHKEGNWNYEAINDWKETKFYDNNQIASYYQYIN